ncbi:MAG TPA: proton-conducting transporter membrane subunit, partial [Spirochaetota bacterium]
VVGNIICAVLFFNGSQKVASLFPSFEHFFAADHLNRLFFYLMVCVFTGSAFTSHRFLSRSADDRWDTIYTVFMLLFVGSMSGVIFSAHLGLLWVFIEATTLTSAVLIYYERTRSSLEATWKYIFVCSIGIAFAFVGIIMLTIGAQGNDSLFFADLGTNISQFSPFWLKMSFVFLLTGLGTKVGLAPVHSWKPDAYSEAPSPVAALLSGALSNAALIGILRIVILMDGAGLGPFAKKLLLFMGIFSVALAALFMLRAHNFKRLLAYSSIEHMGIIAIGVSLGGVALFAAMLHLAAHSLTKSALFFTAGNIEGRWGTKESGLIAGIRDSDPVTGGTFLACIFAITAFPPFAMFVSEFLIVKTMFAEGKFVLAVIFLFFLTVVIYAMAVPVFGMLFGKKDEKPVMLFSMQTHLPAIIFLCAVLLLGLYIPHPVREIITMAAGFIGGN